MSRIPLRPIAITLLAGLTGALLQATATGGVAQVWPGRMVSLTVAILLGPWWGMLTTAIAVSPSATTVPLMAICIVESVVIGLAARRNFSPVMAGGLFWMANGVTFALATPWYG